MVEKCTGCVSKHLSTAAVFLSEVGEEIEGEGDMEKLTEAMGELSHAEKHSDFEEKTDQIRRIRKEIESSIPEGKVPPVEEEITGKAAEFLEILRKNPETCPTCSLHGKEVVHK